MGKGGAGAGAGGLIGSGIGDGAGSGPADAAAQKQKTLLQRIEGDIANIVDNFSHLVNNPPVRNSREDFVMEMCAARMAQAADSIQKLISELKQTAIFSGFASLNDHVDQRMDRMLASIREEASASLKELESHYSSSEQNTIQSTQL